MKKIIFLSGKGGTGKTSVMSCLIDFFNNKVMIDCDVDAANMHLLLNPQNSEEFEFFAGKTAVIDYNKCSTCGKCMEVCRFDSIKLINNNLIKNEVVRASSFHDKNTKSQDTNNLSSNKQDACRTFNNLNRYEIKEFICEGCSYCELVCPEKAISLKDRLAGHYYTSDTKYGTLVHAELDGGVENSGKLVSKIKQVAQEIADSKQNEFMLIDGPPGIGCPVIASLNTVDYVVLVTEPALPAQSDMQRLIKLLEKLKIKYGVVINKYDLNNDYVSSISEEFILGKIPFIKDFKESISQQKTLTEFNPKYNNTFKPIFEKIINETN
jgi:MinD superfamily P-loop ATPase